MIHSPTAAELGLPRAAFHHMVKLGPAWFRRLLVEYLPLKPVQQMKYVVDTMHQTSVDIFEQKKAALRLGEESVVKQVGMGKDIMSILGKDFRLAHDPNANPCVMCSQSEYGCIGRGQAARERASSPDFVRRILVLYD